MCRTFPVTDLTSGKPWQNLETLRKYLALGVSMKAVSRYAI